MLTDELSEGPRTSTEKLKARSLGVTIVAIVESLQDNCRPEQAGILYGKEGSAGDGVVQVGWQKQNDVTKEVYQTSRRVRFVQSIETRYPVLLNFERRCCHVVYAEVKMSHGLKPYVRPSKIYI